MEGTCRWWERVWYSLRDGGRDCGREYYFNSYIVSHFSITSANYSLGTNHDTSTGTSERVHRWKHDMYQQGTRRW